MVFRRNRGLIGVAFSLTITITITIFMFMPTKKFQCFATRINCSNCTPTKCRIKIISLIFLQRRKWNSKLKILKKMKKKKKIPWKEEVLRSLSISFLSIKLSSTARTWNSQSATPIPIAPISLFFLFLNELLRKKQQLAKNKEWERTKSWTLPHLHLCIYTNWTRAILTQNSSLSSLYLTIFCFDKCPRSLSLSLALSLLVELSIVKEEINIYIYKEMM